MVNADTTIKTDNKITLADLIKASEGRVLLVNLPPLEEKKEKKEKD